MQVGAVNVARLLAEQVSHGRDCIPHAPDVSGGNSFDSAVSANDTARLGKTWKVVLPGDTPREREAQMAVIRLTPSYGEIKWRVYGGMIMLLAALLMLKVLPGSGLPLYFSERMQQEWQRYRHGNFDAWLDDADKSTAEHSIPPSRFEYLMLNGYMQEMWNAEQRRLRHEQMQQRQREMEEELRRKRMEAEARQTLEQERLRRRQAGEEALVQLQQLEGRLHQSLSDKQDIQQAIERKEAEMMTLIQYYGILGILPQVLKILVKA